MFFLWFFVLTSLSSSPSLCVCVRVCVCVCVCVQFYKFKKIKLTFFDKKQNFETQISKFSWDNFFCKVGKKSDFVWKFVNIGSEKIEWGEAFFSRLKKWKYFYKRKKRKNSFTTSSRLKKKGNMFIKLKKRKSFFKISGFFFMRSEFWFINTGEERHLFFLECLDVLCCWFKELALHGLWESPAALQALPDLDL